MTASAEKDDNARKKAFVKYQSESNRAIVPRIPGCSPLYP